jgi:hypothetical protein
MQQPPCGSTSRNQKTQTKCAELGSSEIPTVTFCDLLHDEDRYKNKLVRTQARLYGDSGDFGLGDPSCSGENMGARVDFDPTYGIAAEAQKAFDDLLCLPGRYNANKEAEVTVIGASVADGKPGDRHHFFNLRSVHPACKPTPSYGGTNHVSPQLIAPGRGTACCSKLFVRSLLD